MVSYLLPFCCCFTFLKCITNFHPLILFTSSRVMVIHTFHLSTPISAVVIKATTIRTADTTTVIKVPMECSITVDIIVIKAGRMDLPAM